jgi:enoyl-CoA hydratase/carnithine racemase
MTDEVLAVSYIKHDAWAEISLNRPARRNAITGPLGSALAEAFEQAQADDEVQAVLFRGEGGAFCSGLDLDEFTTEPKPDWMATWPAIWRRTHTAIYACNKPIVGALERFAINGGAALIIACDFVVAGDKAFVSVAEVKMGMPAPYNLAWLSLRHGEAVAARLALLGERLLGPQLVQLGLAFESVADESVDARSRELVGEIAAYPAGASARIKGTIRGLKDIDIDAYFERALALSKGGARPPPRHRGLDSAIGAANEA